ncbi:esterase/lipase family protein [Saccharopolyspora mangrovi]|uniref:Alpha/beta fold hydrolase n=1 Tax=Saccharopolyspora mangrovi TaxID=3082379 RepID=A0ABU6AFB6_9PSEU|nr:alpha/beta fold hydrolase [Saccharopolyspora sp. S2-29]MEB3370254.1 alpha/beta fold hydrolase [Saccharopolyspora sp. S2-29]
MRRSLLALALAGAVVVGSGTAQAAPPAVSPPGANDWSCEPSAEHPRPVVLVHGTFENMAKNWSVLAPQIEQAGYCVFALDYGNNATGRIENSAQELSSFVDQVLAATGARQVDLVGHSQGGMMPRHYLKSLGGADKTGELIGIVPSNYGTTTPLTNPTGVVCEACAQQTQGSPFLTELNDGDDTPDGPDHTVITTRYDEVVTPYTNAFLHDGPAEDLANITVQDQCPNNLMEHDQSPNDVVVAQWVLHALDREGPADPGFQPNCLL